MSSKYNKLNNMQPTLAKNDEAWDRKCNGVRELLDAFKEMLVKLYNAVDEKYRDFIDSIEIELDETHKLLVKPAEKPEHIELKVLVRNKEYNENDEYNQEFNLLNEKSLSLAIEKAVEGKRKYLETAFKYLEDFNELKKRVINEAKRTYDYVNQAYEKEAEFVEQLNKKIKQYEQEDEQSKQGDMAGIVILMFLLMVFGMAIAGLIHCLSS